MDSSDTPPTTGPDTTAQATPEAAPASDEIGMGLREIGDELLRAYAPGNGGAGTGGASVRPATQRLDSGTDAATAAEEEVGRSKISVVQTGKRVLFPGKQAKFPTFL